MKRTINMPHSVRSFRFYPNDLKIVPSALSNWALLKTGRFLALKNKRTISVSSMTEIQAVGHTVGHRQQLTVSVNVQNCWKCLYICSAGSVVGLQSLHRSKSLNRDLI